MQRSKSVDDYLRQEVRWRPELEELRRILCTTGLVETIKWGGPCYTYRGKNVVGIGGFKSYFGLWFHQGALLKDEGGYLINAQEGVTRALRQWRMHSRRDIKVTIIRRYVKEAMQLIDDGKEISARRGQAVEVPPALAAAMRRKKGVTAAFRKLSLGKQREYAKYVAEAKRDETRRRRIEKVLPMILAGTGLSDRYR